MGWIVIRFWGKEIKKYLSECVNKIKGTIYKIENGIYSIEYNDGLMVADGEPEYNKK